MTDSEQKPTLQSTGYELNEEELSLIEKISTSQNNDEVETLWQTLENAHGSPIHLFVDHNNMARGVFFRPLSFYPENSDSPRLMYLKLIAKIIGDGKSPINPTSQASLNLYWSYIEDMLGKQKFSFIHFNGATYERPNMATPDTPDFLTDNVLSRRY